MKTIIFRCDASQNIGSGHVIRCRTLARELKKLGANIVFLCRKQKGDLIELLKKEFRVLALPEKQLLKCDGFKGRKLYESWLGCSEVDDADDCIRKLAEADVFNSCWIVVDHYGLSVKWEKRMISTLQSSKNTTRLLAIDDLADRYHEADIVLDQNYFGANTDKRYQGLVPSNCLNLVGPHYALLGPEYAQLHQLVPRRTELRRVLVFFGGVDPDNLTCRTLEALMHPELKNLAVDVVIGRQSQHLQLAMALANRRQYTSLYTYLPSLAGLIARADLGIGACGSTTWERACLGLPSLVVTIADNQLPVAQALEKSKHLQLLGDRNNVTISKIQSALLDRNSKQFAEKAGKSLTDGWGTTRLALSMLGITKKINLRPADENDESLLLRWANDSNVRSNSFSPELIAPDDHKKWFKKALADSNQLILIAHESTGCPIGQIRFELNTATKKGELKESRIDISLDKFARGHGLASELINKGLQLMREHWGSEVKAIAEVLESNAASNACFASAGFLRENIDIEDAIIKSSEPINRWILDPKNNHFKPKQAVHDTD